jgi:hypothetical protein
MVASSSVIVLVIDEDRVFALECESEPPILIYPYRPEPGMAEGADHRDESYSDTIQYSTGARADPVPAPSVRSHARSARNVHFTAVEAQTDDTLPLGC